MKLTRAQEEMLIQIGLNTLLEKGQEEKQAFRTGVVAALREAERAASAPIADPTYREGYEDGKATTVAAIQRMTATEEVFPGGSSKASWAAKRAWATRRARKAAHEPLTPAEEPNVPAS